MSDSGAYRQYRPRGREGLPSARLFVGACRNGRRALAVLLLAYAGPSGFAQTDTVASRALGEAAVTARRKLPPLRRKDDGAFLWDLRQLEAMPQFLGAADPLRYARLLPGVQTAAEYDSGLHVQGCDNAHNTVSMAAVAVYNPSHALGLFSTFNASHFPSMSFAVSPNRGRSPARLGGAMDMEPPADVPQRTSGELSAGPMSLQGTLRARLGKQTALVVSGRGSFLNLFYGSLLRVDGSQLEYFLGDANLTLVHDNGRDRVRVNLYAGADDLAMKEHDYQARASLFWTNRLASVEWLRRGRRADVEQRLFYTGYASRLRLQETTMDFHLRSGVDDAGYAAQVRMGPSFSAGAEAVLHRVRPQSPQLEGGYVEAYDHRFRQSAGEYALHADLSRDLRPGLTLRAGLRAVLFDAPGGSLFGAPMPSVELALRRGPLRFRAGYSYREQYLFQAGFSSLGLPTEFWFSSDRDFRPQTAHSWTAAVEGSFGDGTWAFSAEAYFKRLGRQVEYDGTIFDFLTTRYELAASLRQGRGRNFGANLMLRKDKGRLTGWISYSFSRALRTYAGEDGTGGERTFAANHDRPHELNVVAAWRTGRRWTLGGTFVFASGTPFTAPKDVYLLNGKIFSEYAARNAARLRPYRRLDLSASVRIGSLTRTEQGVNLSLYNALGWSNDLFYRVKVYKGSFAYRPVRFLVKVLPSVSYYVKF